MAPTSSWIGNPKTACFIFPEASGHINASLALSARLAKKSGWTVHYLSASVMKECIENSGATFDDEREAAPELCEGGLGYFAAYEQLRKAECPPGSNAWESRAHIENKFLLTKLPGTMEWLKRKRPSVVVYCPIWNRVAQLAALALGIPHVAIVTIAGFGGFHKILTEFIEPEGGTIDKFRQLYESSDINKAAIDELCAPPFNLDRKLFQYGSPPYYFGRDPDHAPYGMTLGTESLVTTIASLRDPIYDSIEEEDKLYEETCGVKLHYVGPMLGEPGQQRASTHKAVFTVEEQKLLIEQSEQTHRRRSNLHPSGQEDLIGLVKAAKTRGRPIVLVSLGTVVTSDRAGFGWHGTGLGKSITGKQLVQSVINGVLDVAGLSRLSLMESVKVDESTNPLVICACGQQPDALDSIDLPPNAICRASVPQVDILRCMDSTDCFVQHGGQNSTMEGLRFGIPMVVCPTFSDQPVNAAKLVSLGVGIKVDRPTVSGNEAVESYRNEIANAVRTMQSDQDTYATAARDLKKQVELSGGEATAEVILIRAIERGL